jgi:hypothetical protein
VEYGAGVERIVGRVGERGGRGVRGICHRIGDTGIDLVAFDAVRLFRTAAELWPGAAHGRDGAELDDG